MRRAALRLLLDCCPAREKERIYIVPSGNAERSERVQQTGMQRAAWNDHEAQKVSDWLSKEEAEVDCSRRVRGSSLLGCQGHSDMQVSRQITSKVRSWGKRSWWHMASGHATWCLWAA